MKNIRTFFTMYKQLLGILTSKQKIKGVILIILLIFVSILEMLGISVVIPFIIAMLEPELLLNNKYIVTLQTLFYKGFGKYILFL